MSDVAWSPNGDRIASSSWEGSVQVWSPNTGQHFFSYSGHTGGVNAVAWSLDGKIAFGGGNFFNRDNTVQIWDASTGQHLFSYTNHSSYVYIVAWSPDGTRIASVSDGVLQVWQAI